MLKSESTHVLWQMGLEDNVKRQPSLSNLIGIQLDMKHRNRYKYSEPLHNISTDIPRS